MAVESPFTIHDNIFVDEDKVLRFYVRTGSPIVIASPAADGATTLTIDPAKEAITSGEKLRFGHMVVDVGANVAIGDTSITVTALTGTLPLHAVGFLIQDVTGWTTSLDLYESPGMSSATLTVSGSVTTANEGVIDVTVADTDTVSLTPRKYYYRFRRTDAGNEQVLAYGDFVLRA